MSLFDLKKKMTQFAAQVDVTWKRADGMLNRMAASYITCARFWNRTLPAKPYASTMYTSDHSLYQVMDTWSPFHQHRLTLIPACISSYIQSGVWNYLPIPKLRRLHHWSLGMDTLISSHTLRVWDYLSIKIKDIINSHKFNSIQAHVYYSCNNTYTVTYSGRLHETN